MADLVIVRIIRSFRKWNSGETAGFPADQAELLVQQGAAEYIVARPVEEAPVEVVEEAAAEPEEEVEAEAEEEVEAEAEEEVEAEAEEEVTVEIKRRRNRLWLVYDDGRDDEGPYTKRELREAGYDV